jgi:HD-like signal output (HDOD) protein
VKNIAIAASISRMFKGQQVGAGFTAKDIWRHSVGVGAAGRLIAKVSGYAGAGEEVFLAGLIHDLGLLVERQAFPEKLTQVIERCMTGCGDFLALEEEMIGATHQDFGIAITTKWKFPKNLRAVIGMHHNPDRLAPELLAFGNIIHLADILCCQNKIGFHLTAANEEVTDELLEQVGISREKLPEISEMLAEAVSNAEACLATE